MYLGQHYKCIQVCSIIFIFKNDFQDFTLLHIIKISIVLPKFIILQFN